MKLTFPSLGRTNGRKDCKKNMKISNQARPQEKSFSLMFESHSNKMGGLEFRHWETED
jgi:hypothetical protein